MHGALPEKLFADLTQGAAVDTAALGWIPSPARGVDRKPLDRDGGEVARATSIVRYAPGSRFASHPHDRGEEFLVLDGVFADEHGRYPAGTYVRNPPGSAHTPFSAEGCTIFVKLRQMSAADRRPVVIDTTRAPWCPTGRPGHWRMTLYANAATGEAVQLERLAAGAGRGPRFLDRGEEIFVLDGSLLAEGDRHQAGAWLRRPAGTVPAMASPEGCRYWVKRGHLPARGSAA